MAKQNEKIWGTLISYSSIFLQFFINIFFIPILIKSLGNDEYGLYETINSFGSTLAFINFGISSILSRNIIKYLKEKDEKKLSNFLAICSFISMIIFICIGVFGFVASLFIDQVYKDTLTDVQINKAKIMFIYIIINLAFSSFHNYTNGIMVGYEKFKFVGILKLLRQSLRVILLSVLIFIKIDALDVVKVDLLVTFILFLIESLYCKFKLKVKIKYYSWDKIIFKEVLLFSLASILQTVTNQINLSLDKVILGATMSTNIVALYAVGLLIVNVMVSILQTINGVYLPDATRLVLKKASGTEMTDFVISPGRIQCMIGCAIVFGFLVIGKEFLTIWVGKEFQEIWLSTVILLVFTMISYVSSVANVILDAMLKKIYRSIILIMTAIVNVILTLILVKPLGYLGAALGTAISMLIGNITLLNLYYKNKIGLEIFRMYKEIFRGILPCAIIAAIMSYFVKYIINKNSFWGVAVIIVTFLVTFIIGLLIFGFNKKEKGFVRNTLSKFRIINKFV